ncbi:hypothetical protein EYF80_044010 [Liparis tanakae]|uniref:Uncharacterized protein n=1 Tax=Liparis tanakae TaxID=230148 RepID=A0A4Z2FY36_9TELE|nr:hypothetical protein EYF80_044010 [Liparis tanakae]
MEVFQIARPRAVSEDRVVKKPRGEAPPPRGNPIHAVLLIHNNSPSGATPRVMMLCSKDDIDKAKTSKLAHGTM